MKVIIQKAPNSTYENDGHNNSALHLAAQIGNSEIVERLMKVHIFDFALSSRYVIEKVHLNSRLSINAIIAPADPYSLYEWKSSGAQTITL